MVVSVRHSLVEEYRRLHENPRPGGDFWFSGYSIEPHLETIAKIAKAHGTKTILDYGCGKGLQYTERKWHKAWGIMPTLYDPAVPALAELPKGPFDGVICTDVLEHIPEDELDDVILDLVELAKKWCYITVCCRPSDKKFLSDGRNVHVTLMPERWWRRRLYDAFDDHASLYLEFTP